MKKITSIVLSVLMCLFIFSSFSPSLDGRAVVADKGTMPEGLFARTVGYLPGDSISVTNLAKKISVDILVIGALDPSEGVAILLSPEAAKVLGMENESNNVVKITKRSGQLDEQVSGTAVIADAPAIPETKDESEDTSSSEVADASESSSDVENAETEYEYDWKSDVSEDVASTEPFKGDEDALVMVPGEELIDDKKAEDSSVVPDELDSLENAPEEKVTDEKIADASSENEGAGEGLDSSKADEIASDVKSDENSEESDEDAEVITATVAEDVPESEPFVEKIEDEADAKRLEYASAEEKVVPDDLLEPEESVVKSSGTPDSVSLVPYKEDELVEDSLANSEKSEKDDEKEAEKVPSDSSEKIASEKVDSDKIDADDESSSVAENEDEKAEEEIAEAVEEKSSSKVEEPKVEEALVSEKVEGDDLSDIVEEKIDNEVASLDSETAEEDEYTADLSSIVDEKDSETLASAKTEKPAEKVSEESISEAVEKDELSDIDDKKAVASKIYEEEEPYEEGYAPIILVPSDPKTPEHFYSDAEDEALKREIAARKEAERREAERREWERRELARKEAERKQKEAEIAASRRDEKKSSNWNELVKDSYELKKGSWYVQVALLSDKKNIENFVGKYGSDYPVVLVPLSSGNGYQVLVGSLSMDEYGTVLNRFKSYGFKDAFVKKIR